MRCDSCGKRRRLFESFSEINTEGQKMHLCVKCTTLLYKMRDFAEEGLLAEYTEAKEELEKGEKQFSSLFLNWYEKNYRHKLQ